MECRQPDLLRDDQLLAYLDGASAPAVVHHLESCPPCRNRLAALAQSERRLTTAFHRFQCPPALRLGEYQLALLPAPEQAAIAVHLASCPHCAQEVAQLQAFLAATSLAQTSAPVATPSFLAGLRVVIAQLRDGLSSLGALHSLTPALAPVRGNESGQQIFDASEGVQIIIDSLAEAPLEQQRTLLGLIVGDAVPAPLTATLWQGEQLLASVPVDPVGNFVLTDLTSGSYTLILSNDAIAYQIAPLQL